MSNACPWMPLYARILAIRYSTHLKRTRRSNAAFIGHRPSPSGSIEGKQHLAGILTMRKMSKRAAAAWPRKYVVPLLFSGASGLS